MPTIKMTARGVEALKPPAEGRAEYFDASLPGFALRVSDAGRKTWIVLYRVNGRLRRMTLGTYPNLPLADAREQAEDALRAAAKGRDPAGEKQAGRKAETFAELADEYLERYAKAKKRSWRKDQQIIEKDLKPTFRTWKAKDVTRKDVLRLLDKIKDRGAPIQANRTLEVIRRMYNWGIERSIVEANPAHHVAKPAQENRRDRVLSDDEIRALWTAFDGEGPLMAAAFKLRLITAQRGGEVLGMRRTELDPELSWWTIPAERSKNKLPHRVPLSKLAQETLRVALEKSAGLPVVFPNPSDLASLKHERPGYDPEAAEPMWAIWKAAERIRKSAGVEDFDPHDLRRTAASNMTSMGIPRLVVSKILNHAEKGVTAVYDRHSYDAEKRHALDAWAAKLQQILDSSKEEESNVVALRG